MINWQTKRIILRPFDPEQVPTLYTHLNHPALVGRRYIPHGFPLDIPLSYQQIESILKKWGEKKQGFNLAILLPEGKEIIGHINCDWGWDTHCPYVSLVIYQPYQRNGYASEALGIFLEYIFNNTPAYNISSRIEEWNMPALEFAQKSGFTKCGRSRRVRIRNGVSCDCILVDMLKDEWLTRPRGYPHGS
jgi:RimJ/RimL family protein N-acetyltransferase